MRMVAVVSSKGQVTLPARMRVRLGVGPGSDIIFDEQPNGDYIIRRQAEGSAGEASSSPLGAE
jgi:AbrB family looped-hinge helix DNA binding protein